MGDISRQDHAAAFVSEFGPDFIKKYGKTDPFIAEQGLEALDNGCVHYGYTIVFKSETKALIDGDVIYDRDNCDDVVELLHGYLGGRRSSLKKRCEKAGLI